MKLSVKKKSCYQAEKLNKKHAVTTNQRVKLCSCASKVQANDYRFIPDPDLTEIHIDEDMEGSCSC